VGLGWLSPLIFYITTKEKSKFTAFYSAQALLLGLAFFAIIIVGIILTFVLALIFAPLAALGYILYAAPIVYLVVLIMGIIKSSNGEWWEMPLVGEYAKKMVGL
jgi:uncharacterized membrane protein